MTKIFEGPQYDVYELENDSLSIVAPFEILADQSGNGSVFTITDLQTVNIQNEKSDPNSLVQALNLSVDDSFISQERPGTVKGQKVVSLVINVARYSEENESFSVVRYAKIRVNKSTSTSTSASASRMADHPLSSGTWYKIPITEGGIYQLDRDYLENLGISTSSIDPRNIQIWGTDGNEIPRANNIPRVAFQQIPIIVEGESDGNFDTNDRVIFYGDDTNMLSWDNTNLRFIPEVHPYSLQNFYFLRVASTNGQRMTPVNNGLNATRVVTSFKDVVWKEEELFKADAGLKSGREWLGERFESSENGNYKSVMLDTIPGLLPNQQIQFFSNVVGRSERNMSFDLRFNGTDIGTQSIPPINDYSSEEGAAGIERRINRDFNATFENGIVNVEARIRHNESNSQGFIDYIRFYADRNLLAEDNFIQFFAPQNGSLGEIGDYQVEGFSSAPTVLDVTEQSNPRLINSDFASNTLSFNYSTNPETIFIAQANFRTPAAGEEVPNQNISGTTDYPDYVIITSERFLDIATDLANHRRSNDGLNPIVVTQNQIFNEFSSGKTDITAIRDFLKALYDNALANAQETPKYLLFFGNTTYDFKGLIPNSLTNDVVTYQSQQSLFRTATFATDDYFGTLDNDEGDPLESTTDDRIDLGIGRIPAETRTEARIMLEKLIAYDTQQFEGDWQNLITFAADDDFPNIQINRDIHVLNAEGTLIRMDREGANIRFKRIYQFAYPKETTGAGRQVPEATNDFISTINQGTILMNYSGHGNEQVLSDEELFVTDFIELFDNSDRLTIFVTATCQFGRYDDTDEQSGAEKLVFAPNGGAIASFTTTRVVFTGTSINNNNNFGLNIALSQQLTGRDDDGRPLRLGDIYYRTKNTSVGGSRNSRKFILIGDPATRIRLPDEAATVTSINGDTNFASNDSLSIRALDTVELAGEVRDASGNLRSDFSGDMTVSVFDAARAVTYDGTEWTRGCELDDCTYFTQNDLIFKGRTRVNGGVYQTQFVVPKDISFSDESGRILLFASDGNSSAGGSYMDITFNGINPDAVNDGEGPELDIYLNDQNFVNGNLVSDTPTLIVELSDETGINTTGTGVGHEIIATIDTQPQSTVVLNPFYEGNLDDFTGGRIEYPLEQLPEGRYTLTVRAWDVQNNPSEQSITFEVAPLSDLSIRNVYNYPNPMHNTTQFSFEHNQPGNPLDVSVKIYTLNGRPVNQLNETILTSNSYASIPWNGRDRDNDRLGNGTYLYVLRVATDTPEGRQVFEKVEKLVIIR